MILLIISFLIIACLIHQIRRLKSSKENSENNRKEKNYSKGIYENPDKLKDDGNYEQMEDIQPSTYTALKRPEDENEHLYTHLQMNELQHDSMNQEKSGIEGPNGVATSLENIFGRGPRC